MEWIKVTESLPDDDREVLVLVRIQGGFYLPDLGCYVSDDNGELFWDMNVNGEVVAWCDIPDFPPKGL